MLVHLTNLNGFSDLFSNFTKNYRKVSITQNLDLLYSNTASEAQSVAQSELMFSEPGKRKSGLDKVNDGLRNFLKELRAMSADRIRSASQNRGKPFYNF